MLASIFVIGSRLVMTPTSSGAPWQVPAGDGKRRPGRLMRQQLLCQEAALPCRCSCTAALLPEEAFFDFRINLVEPTLCALCSVPVRLGLSL